LRKLLAPDAIPARYRELAQIRIAAAQGARAAAAPALPQAKSADPEVASQAAAALSRWPARRGEAVAHIDRIVDEGKKKGAALPMRAVTNALVVYARAGAVDKAFALAASADLGRPSYVESIGAAKVLRFYDPALLGGLAELYQSAAERLLEQAVADDRLKHVAGYFLAESHLCAGGTSKAAALLPQVVAAAELPQALRSRAVVLQAAADARAARASPAFDALARTHAEDPVMLAELLGACVRSGAECGAVGGTARELAGKGQGERFRRLHWAIGMQHAAAHQPEQAIVALETARDKANKNKIDTNDPLLLNLLADLYLETKSFSENLEIYFELSKEFPAVRQLQEAGQGVYSMEYRSAGDVKIF